MGVFQGALFATKPSISRPSRIALGLISFLSACLLTSCATVMPSSQGGSHTSWEARQLVLNHLHRWQINGKIAVQTARDAGSATVDWTQVGAHYSIALMGPLGSNQVKMSGQPGHVSMVMANGKHFTASSPEQLLLQQWGWNLPISNLRYWIRGLPIPGMAANTHFDNYHRLSDLTQQGWHIQYLDYTQVNGIELPARLSITSPSLKSKLIVYSWNIH